MVGAGDPLGEDDGGGDCDILSSFLFNKQCPHTKYNSMIPYTSHLKF